MHFEKAFRTAGLTLVAAVAVLTFAVAAQASEKTVAYSLAAGASSKTITPVANKPVFVMGAQTTEGNVGSGETTLVNSNPGDGELVWSGLESNGGGPTAGFSPTAGTHIIFIDFGHCVDLEVANATSFLVHNGCTAAQTGRVTLTW